MNIFGFVQMKSACYVENESNLNHVLASCNVALTQGRYRWRHDQVLKEIAKLTEERVTDRQLQPWLNRMQFDFWKKEHKVQKHKK